MKAWVKKPEEEIDQIEHLGDRTINEIKKDVLNPDSQPIQLDGLKNIWFFFNTTRKGSVFVNIVKTAN